MTAILAIFTAHWALSIFAQTFFHHRYAAHRMFTMSPAWERFFYVFSFLAQGPSFLIPRAYAILHREHHAFSDTERDPHSPRFFSNAGAMMWKTKDCYGGYAYRTAVPEARFDAWAPCWPLIDGLSQRWDTRFALGGVYWILYWNFAPSLGWLLLLPVHWLMGPIHGAIVNWCGHRYGYRNFALDDDSRNTLPVDFLTFGELFQNNHHRFASSPNFAVRWFEVDFSYQIMRGLAWAGIIEFVQDLRATENSAAAQRSKTAPITPSEAPVVT